MEGRRGVSAAERFEPVPGWCAREVEQELPQLRVLSAEVQVGHRGPLTGSSPAHIRERLRELSNRFRGARAVGVRREHVPAAYRVFFHQIGLDPDIVRTPIEAVVLERMLHGGFFSAGLLSDVLLIALMDTGVRVWALDAESVDGPLGIRPSREGERLGRSPTAAVLAPGRLVIADASSALALLFDEPASMHAPAAASRRLTLFAVQVPGVPALYVEEALWSCYAALERP
jgi:DNA/RNA-binding domain of Phe-tRNA-synthetase-like protein